MTQALPELPDFCWPVDTSCIPGWDALEDPDEPAGEDNPPRYTALAKARAVSLAGFTLRMLTGFRVGGCPVTVRPCRARCSEETWRPLAYGAAPWMPVSLGGRWLNIACGHDSLCGCTGLAEVRLPLPASQVTEVRVDGALLASDAYRLDPGGRLVRVNGGTWPLAQDLGAPETEVGTWSVTYLPGAPVDGLGAWAAGILTSEFLIACGDDADSCRLPTGVTQIARNGITMTLTTGAFPEGKTGIREVDSWLEGINPHGLRAAPTVWSRDTPHHRATATT